MSIFKQCVRHYSVFRECFRVGTGCAVECNMIVDPADGGKVKYFVHSNLRNSTI